MQIEEFIENPAVWIVGALIVIAVLIYFLSPYFPIKCKDCGWKGMQKRLVHNGRHDTYECPNCRKALVIP